MSSFRQGRAFSLLTGISKTLSTNITWGEGGGIHCGDDDNDDDVTDTTSMSRMWRAGIRDTRACNHKTRPNVGEERKEKKKKKSERERGKERKKNHLYYIKYAFLCWSYCGWWKSLFKIKSNKNVKTFPAGYCCCCVSYIPSAVTFFSPLQLGVNLSDSMLFTLFA